MSGHRAYLPHNVAIGQKVLCVKEGVWIDFLYDNVATGPMPENGKTYTVNRLVENNCGTWIGLEEFSTLFRTARFKPIQPCELTPSRVENVLETPMWA